MTIIGYNTTEDTEEPASNKTDTGDDTAGIKPT